MAQLNAAIAVVVLIIFVGCKAGHLELQRRTGETELTPNLSGGHHKHKDHEDKNKHHDNKDDHQHNDKNHHEQDNPPPPPPPEPVTPVEQPIPVPVVPPAKGGTPQPGKGDPGGVQQNPNQAPVMDGAGKITQVTVNHSGDGCQQNTVQTTLTPMNDALTVIYTNFVAEAGPDLGRTEHEVGCQLRISLELAPGTRLGLVEVTHRGYAHIDAQAQGTLQSLYHFGQKSQAQFSRIISGAYEQDFLFTDRVDATAVAWSGCGGAQELVLDNTLKVVTEGTASALLTVDSTDQQFQQTYGLVWQACGS